MCDRTRLKIQNVRIIIMQDVIHSGLFHREIHCLFLSIIYINYYK